MADTGGLQALGAFLQSLGGSGMNFARDAYTYSRAEEDRGIATKEREYVQGERNKKAQKEKRLEDAKTSGSQKIRSALQVILNPGMDAEEAQQVLQSASPQEIQKAEELIKKTGEAVSKNPQNLPLASQTSTYDKYRDTLRSVFKNQESGNRYDILHPQAANGLQAVGAYGIVPKYHFAKVGLNADKPEDIRKFLQSPELQDEAFDKIMQENLQKYDGDTSKAIAAYYGGDGAAKLVGTPEGNRKQKLANGKEMPSINEYVDSVKVAIKDFPNSIEGVAGTARSAVNRLINTTYEKPARNRKTQDTLNKLYADLTPEEIEGNKGTLDYISSLAQGEKEDYDKELGTFLHDVDRQYNAAINAMKLDEQYRQLDLKLRQKKYGQLSDDEVAALRARKDTLLKLKQNILDFSAQTGRLKPSERQSHLKSRPDLAKKNEPNFWQRTFGREPDYEIDDVGIRTRLEELDEKINETEEALAGIGGLPQNPDKTSKTPKGVISNYMTPRAKTSK